MAESNGSSTMTKRPSPINMERQPAHHGQPHLPRHGRLLADLHGGVRAADEPDTQGRLLKASRMAEPASPAVSSPRNSSTNMTCWCIPLRWAGSACVLRPRHAEASQADELEGLSGGLGCADLSAGMNTSEKAHHPCVVGFRRSPRTTPRSFRSWSVRSRRTEKSMRPTSV